MKKLLLTIAIIALCIYLYNNFGIWAALGAAALLLCFKYPTMFGVAGAVVVIWLLIKWLGFWTAIIVIVVIILVIYSFSHPKVFTYLIIFGIIYFSITGMKSCGAEKPVAKVTNLSVGYLTEEDYNEGNFEDSLISKRPTFKKNSTYYMVIDFTVKTLQDNEGDETIRVFAQAANALSMNMMIEEAPTGMIESLTGGNGDRAYALSYTIPAKKRNKKTVRMILKIVPQESGKVELDVAITGNDIPIKGKTDKSQTLRVNS